MVERLDFGETYLLRHQRRFGGLTLNEYSLDSARFHDHLDRRQRCLNVMHMRWPNRHWNDTDVQTAVGGDEFNAGK